MSEFNLFYTYRCFLCHGMGRLAIVDPKNIEKIPSSLECPMCNGNGYQKIQKTDCEEGG